MSIKKKSIFGSDLFYIILEKYYLCFNVFSPFLSYLFLPFFSDYSKYGYFEK